MKVVYRKQVNLERFIRLETIKGFTVVEKRIQNPVSKMERFSKIGNGKSSFLYVLNTPL